MARIDKSSPIRLGLLALAGALLCLVLWVVLFDPLPSILDVVNTAWIRWQLPAARECWASSGVASCRVDVEGSVPMACLLDGELAVREGRVVGVRMRTNALIPGSPLQDVDPSEWGRPGCAYEDLTVDSMFDRLKADLSRAGLSGAPLTVAFDKQRGYVTENRFGRSSYGGVFGYTVSECCMWFELGSLATLEA